jgi:CheY-like chemotaxis protein
MQILMVDDDKTDVELMTHRLKRLDATVYQVNDCDAAIELLHTRPIDGVLLDHGLIGRGGLDCLEKVRRVLTFLSPIIMVTGYDGPEVARDAFRAGADDFFLKTDSMEWLAEIVENAIARRQTLMILKKTGDSDRVNLNTIMSDLKSTLSRLN